MTVFYISILHKSDFYNIYSKTSFLTQMCKLYTKHSFRRELEML